MKLLLILLSLNIFASDWECELEELYSLNYIATCKKENIICYIVNHKGISCHEKESKEEKKEENN